MPRIKIIKSTRFQAWESQALLRMMRRAKLELIEQPWHGCSCSLWAAQAWQHLHVHACPVHHNPDNGVALLWDLLVCMLPECQIWAQWPCWSVYNAAKRSWQGRDFLTGNYSGDADLYFDFLIEAPTGICCAAEVNGREHAGAKGLARDGKKVECASKLGLRVGTVWVGRNGQPSSMQSWVAAVQQMRKWLFLSS